MRLILLGDPYLGLEVSVDCPTFTLRDAARASENRSSLWDSSFRLRHQAISFVSGGTNGAMREHFEEYQAEIDEDLAMEETFEEDDDNMKTTETKESHEINEMHRTETSTASLEQSTSSLRHAPERLSHASTLQIPGLEQNQTRSISAKRDESTDLRSQHRRRRPSPTPSNSSEDVVVFMGRNKLQKMPLNRAEGENEQQQGLKEPNGEVEEKTPTLPTSKGEPHHATQYRPHELEHGSPGQHDQVGLDSSLQPPTGTNVAAYHSSREIVEAAHSMNKNMENTTIMNAEETITHLLQNQGKLHDVTENRSVMGTPRKLPRRKRRRPDRARLHRYCAPGTGSESGDDVLDDYVDNLLANGAIETHKPESSQNLIPGRQETPIASDGWGYTELEDFANISTSEEVRETVSHVLSRRERASGLQYLVVWDGQSHDEARWIRHEALVHQGKAGKLISGFEERRQAQLWNEARDAEIAAAEWTSDFEADKVIVAPESSSEDQHTPNGYEDDADDTHATDESGDSDDADAEELAPSDEEDLIQRRKERMTDEHIARLLQHQEELGMNADDLALFDGVEDEMEANVADPYLDQFFQCEDAKVLPGRSRRTKRKARNRNASMAIDGTQSDALVEEDLNDFDIMDWHRGSLANVERKQRSRHQLDIAALELEDSDLERQLQTSWAADKQKKKLKKIEREEMRAEGLLGGSGKKHNQSGSTRRAKGLSLNEFEDELEDFLGSSRQQLALPPMDKKLRKIIHEIANPFGLKSKSSGTGNNRFPILYRTARTKRFDPALFDKLSERYSRRFGVFGGGSQRGKAPGALGGKGTFGMADGQRVGAGAKEIGVDNKGRAMLEKMGWSKGTALGAVDNKGILMPIDSVMKKTRAGLG
ncbi:MAG: hypothetical protein Q9159_005621 [Coniocarpon cinnabarinum]